MTNPERVPQWDLADRMRKSLREAKVGVGEMAGYLDVERNTVGSWINGRITPRTQTLRLWALRCGVPYEWLVTGATSLNLDSEPTVTYPPDPWDLPGEAGRAA